MRIDVGGAYQVNNSRVFELDTSLAVKPVDINITGGGHIATYTDSIKKSSSTSILLDGTVVYFPNGEKVNSILETDMRNVSFPTVGSSINISSDNPSSDSGTYNLIANVTNRNECQLTYTVGGVVDRFMFLMPSVGFSVAGLGNNGENIVLKRTGEKVIQATSGPNIKLNIMGIANR